MKIGEVCQALAQTVHGFDDHDIELPAFRVLEQQSLLTVARPLELICDHAQGETRHLRETLVRLVAHDLDQGGQLRGSCRRDDAEFRKVCAQCIDGLGLLAHEKLGGLQHHGGRLLVADLTGTKRIVLHVTASQIAAASAARPSCHASYKV